MTPKTIRIAYIMLSMVGFINLLPFITFILSGAAMEAMGVSLGVFINFASAWALRHMKRWGAYLSLGFYSIATLIFLSIPTRVTERLDNPFIVVIIPITLCLLILPHWKRLT